MGPPPRPGPVVSQPAASVSTGPSREASPSVKDEQVADVPDDPMGQKEEQSPDLEPGDAASAVGSASAQSDAGRVYTRVAPGVEQSIKDWAAKTGCSAEVVRQSFEAARSTAGADIPSAPPLIATVCPETEQLYAFTTDEELSATLYGNDALELLDPGWVPSEFSYSIPAVPHGPVPVARMARLGRPLAAVERRDPLRFGDMDHASPVVCGVGP